MSRTWADIAWDAPRPAQADIQRSREHLAFQAYDLDDPAVVRVLEVLRQTHVNGGGILKGFRVVESDAVLQWFASRNRFSEYDFFSAFLGSSGVREALPELAVPDPLGHDLGFEESGTGTLTLDGELAAMLVHGGAYERFKGPATEAKKIGGAFVEAVVGGRHEEFKVYRSYASWSPWFCDIAWDVTWLLIDLRREHLVLLCVTDAD